MLGDGERQQRSRGRTGRLGHGCSEMVRASIVWWFLSDRVHGWSYACAEVTLEACSSALAAGDGRELWKMTGAGQLESVVGGKCVVLGGNSPVGGGVVELADCQSSAETGDGRSFWSLTPSAQLSMARGGGCAERRCIWNPSEGCVG